MLKFDKKSVAKRLIKFEIIQRFWWKLRLMYCSFVDGSWPALVRSIMAVVTFLPFNNPLKCLVAIDDHEMCHTGCGNNFRRIENDVLAYLRNAVSIFIVVIFISLHNAWNYINWPTAYSLFNVTSDTVNRVIDRLTWLSLHLFLLVPHVRKTLLPKLKNCCNVPGPA